MTNIPLSSHAETKLREKPLRLKLLAKFFQRYRKQRRKILLDNALDYRRSRQLAPVLAQFAKAKIAEMSVIEQQIGGDWRPFRVEHTLSGSLRGNLGPTHFSGTVTPNLLESSSALFLQNTDGKTLRALIPSQATAREMLAAAIKEWARQAGNRTSWGYDYDNTHLGRLLHNFVMIDGWSHDLAHAHTIDSLNASCEKPVEERPIVRVRGRLIQEGVALATALEVNGAIQVLMPTCFFTLLAANVSRIGRISTRNDLVPAI